VAAEAPATDPDTTEAPSSIVDSGGSLRADTDRLAEVFTAAYEARDVDGCVAAILDLEQVQVDWSADTDISDEGEHARATLRSMVVRLGELAEVGARDPREVLGPFVQTLLTLRGRARDGRDFATADTIRDRLAAAGVEVRDTAHGVEWDLR
jgi:cysteinyl-tRNA synthetase